MIHIVLHNESLHDRVDAHEKTLDVISSSTIDKLIEIAQDNPNVWIGWTKNPHASWDELQSQAHNNYTLVSKGKAPDFIQNGIDYIEDSPFINFKPHQWYPTWITSADQGMIHASILGQVKDFPTTGDFELDLNLLARAIQPQGVFCYSKLSKPTTSPSYARAYHLVARSVKKRWLPFLWLCHLVYEKRFPMYAFAKACFKQPLQLHIDLASLQQTQVSKTTEAEVYEVVIPTMGRPSYLYDVLKDLALQTLLPQAVYIVEQNPDPNAVSELDYLTGEKWPFAITHELIHQTGACNARNLAIEKTTAPWVLLFDDDVRLSENFSFHLFNALQDSNSKSITVACLQEDEQETQKTYKQWPYFGSGCSIVHRDIVNLCRFDMALEHGYGEDVDYGMQIRHAGYDVIYAPQIQIKHLKAPVGGFRQKKVFPWTDDKIQPKPSPPIMYFRKKNYSTNQLKGYKMVLWFKTYGAFGTKLPWLHHKKFQRAWFKSEQYAAQL